MAVNTTGTLVMDKSYNENSDPQLVAIQSTIPYIREAIDLLNHQPSCFPFIIADFGSSHGRNSLHVMKFIIQYLKETHRIKDETQILVVHNDHPTNDWSRLFNLLSEDNSYHNAASGRSFYESCLPPKSLWIGYSSTALHWLSRKPCNISNHCASLFAQGDELRAFQEQARLDWAHFLEHRSHELISGGVLILLIPCVNDRGSNGIDIFREILYKCAQVLLTSQELLEYTFPIHHRSYSECVDDQLFARYSLQLVKSDFGSVKLPFIERWESKQITMDEFAGSITSYMRGWSESTLKQALSTNNRPKHEIEEIINQFWSLFAQEARKESCNLLDIWINHTYLILKKL